MHGTGKRKWDRECTKVSVNKIKKFLLLWNYINKMLVHSKHIASFIQFYSFSTFIFKFLKRIFTVTEFEILYTKQTFGTKFKWS